MDTKDREAVKKSMLDRLMTQLDILEEKSKREENTPEESVDIANTISYLIDN